MVAFVLRSISRVNVMGIIVHKFGKKLKKVISRMFIFMKRRIFILTKRIENVIPMKRRIDNL